MPPAILLITTTSAPSAQLPEFGFNTVPALKQKWGQSIFDNDGDILINLAANAPIDYNDRDGISAGSASFEGLLYHEIFHILGFKADVRPGSNISPQMTDLFRLSSDAVGPTVSGFELYDEPRQVANGYEAVMAVALGISGGAVRMSTGNYGAGFYGDDGFSGNHWKSFSRTGVNLGIMEPKATVPPLPGYLSINDLRALDIIGWNLEPSVEVVIAANSVDPSQVVTTVTPTLTWNSASDASTQQAFVLYEDSDLSPNAKLYEDSDLSYTIDEATIPVGTVQFGHTYYWIVTTYNNAGSASSNVGSFTVRNPLCPSDFDGDELVQDTDFILFVASYNILDCESGAMPANCVADLNVDGLVDDGDFIIFVVAYNELVCP